MPYKFDRSATKKLLADKDTFAFTFMCILLEAYGSEVLDEEIEIISENIKDDFDVRISEEAENRINAAITAIKTDLPLRSFSIFRNVALALATGNIGPEDEQYDDELNACEILWCLYEMALLRSESVEEIKENLSPYVVDKINDVLDDEAEEKDDVAENTEEGVEAITQAQQEVYYNKYVTVSMFELIRQLGALGVSEGDRAAIIENFKVK